MAIGVLFELAGMGQAEYDGLVEQLTGGRGLNSPADWPVDGLIVHMAGPTENGWRVVDVWESEEAFGRFGEKLLPLAQQAGLDLRPQVVPLHNFVK